jgi:hypothetical protein
VLINSGIHSGVTYGANNDNDVYNGDRALGFIVTGETSAWLFYRMLALVDNMSIELIGIGTAH